MVSFLYLNPLSVTVIDLKVSFLNCDTVGECSLLLAVPLACFGEGKKRGRKYVLLCLYLKKIELYTENDLVFIHL